MNYFLTGITGFIGSNLSRKLLQDGHTIHALVRSPAVIEQLELPGIRVFKGDLHDREIIRKGMEGCEVAFHLAAYAKPWSKDPGLARRINVDGTRNVFSAAKEAGIRKIVFTSSAATMSPSHGREPVNEGMTRSMPFFNDYEITKYEAESLAAQFSRDGHPVVTVNPSRVYGPGPLTVANSLTRMIAGYFKGTWRIIPGNGRSIGSYVFIDDVVKGHLLAAEHGRGGERYILAGENLCFDEMFEILGNISGKHRKMIHLPLWLMTGMAGFMEFQVRLTGIPPAITGAWVKKYINDWSLSSDKAARELGYRITPFKEGVKKTHEWLMEMAGKPGLKTDWKFAH